VEVAKEMGKNYKPFPGLTAEEFINAYSLDTREGFLGFINGLQGDFCEPHDFNIIDGKLITRQDNPGLYQQEYEVVNGEFWAFVFDEDNFGVRQVKIENGKLISPEGIQNAIQGVPIIKEGESKVSDIAQANPEEHNSLMEPDVVNWHPRNVRASFTAIGKTGDERIILLTLVEESGDFHQIMLQEFAETLIKLGAEEAILLGGGADARQYLQGRPPLTKNEPYYISYGHPASRTAKGKVETIEETEAPKERPITSYITFWDKGAGTESLPAKIQARRLYKELAETITTGDENVTAYTVEPDSVGYDAASGHILSENETDTAVELLVEGVEAQMSGAQFAAEIIGENFYSEKLNEIEQDLIAKFAGEKARLQRENKSIYAVLLHPEPFGEEAEKIKAEIRDKIGFDYVFAYADMEEFQEDINKLPDELVTIINWGVEGVDLNKLAEGWPIKESYEGEKLAVLTTVADTAKKLHIWL